MEIGVENLAKISAIVAKAQSEIDEIAPGMVDIKTVFSHWNIPESEITRNCNRVIHLICDHFDITVEKFKSAARDRKLVDARKYFFKYIKETWPQLSLVVIGRLINKDHATVLHSVKVFNSLYETDSLFRERYDHLEILLNSMLSKTRR